MYYIKILEAAAIKKDRHGKSHRNLSLPARAKEEGAGSLGEMPAPENHQYRYHSSNAEKSARSRSYQRRIVITNIGLLVVAAGICFSDAYHTHALITATI